MNETTILRATLEKDNQYYILRDSNGFILSYITASSTSNIDNVVNLEKLIEVLSRPYICIKHRICVLNSDETIDYEIPSEDIIEDSISFSENLQNGQRKSLSFRLVNKNEKYTPCINYDYTGKSNFKNIGIHTPLWGNSRFSYEIGIKVNNDIYYWFAKGIYTLSSADISNGDSNKEISITLKDKFSIFEDNIGKLLYTTEIRYNTDCEMIIRDMLRQDTGMGYIYDPKKPLIDLSFKGFQTQTSIRKEQGDTYGSLFGELFTQMNASYYYNDIGNLVVIPINEEMKDEHKPVSWVYTTENNDIENISKSYNLSSAINIIYVEGNNIETKTYSALVVNNDSRSPFAVGYIGKRMGEPVTDCNIWNKQQARDLGIYKLRKNTLDCLQLKADVRFNPLLKINTLIEIEKDLSNYDGNKFIVKDISFSSNNGVMNLSIVDIQSLSFLKVGDENAIGISE